MPREEPEEEEPLAGTASGSDGPCPESVHRLRSVLHRQKHNQVLALGTRLEGGRPGITAGRD